MNTKKTPTSDLVKMVRGELSIDIAAELIHRAARTLRDIEYGVSKMDPAIFELFLIKTGQHPTLKPLPDLDLTMSARAARSAMKLTQDQAAVLIGKKGRTWRKWEGGERQFDKAMLELFLIKATARFSQDQQLADINK